MIDIDKWQEILMTLRQHKLRTLLTAFGVFWGIFMLVVLLGAGTGLRNGVESGFSGTADTVYVWISNVTQFPYKGFKKGRWVGINEEDIDALRNQIPEADLILGMNEAGGWRRAQYVVRGGKSDSYITRGTYPEIAEMQSYVPIIGRYINDFDLEEKRKVAVVGKRVYEVLFEPNENPIGETIEIGGVPFSVVGVFEQEATGDNANRNEEMVLIPNSTLRYTFNQVGVVGSIRMRPQPGVPSALIEQKALAILEERKSVHPDDDGVFGSYNTQKDFEQVQGLFKGIFLFSWFVAIGTILAGVIGVGNIMLIVVKERTREIGLRKALGATARSIVITIIQESIFLTVIAGYLGLVFGVIVLEGLNAALNASGTDNSMFSRPEVDFQTALLALLILVVAGAVAALLPASKAARVNPIVALQDE